MEETAKVLVIGATFAGIGLAQKLGSQALLVERTMLVGHEFINSYRPGHNWNRTPQSILTEQLREQWVSRNLLNEAGGVHIGGLAPSVYKLLLDSRQSLRLMTEVLDVRPRSEAGYEVTLLDATGVGYISVDQIIDTTSECRSVGGKVPLGSKFIGAVLHRETATFVEESLDVPIEHAELLTGGLFASEAYLQFPVEATSSWDMARDQLHHYWISRPEPLRPWTIAAIADVFTVRTHAQQAKLGEGWVWMPSCGFDNPLHAMDKGFQYGDEVLQHER
ncbi:hypothetical protein ASG89_27205 [Paenibacillus sp. Soil766]|uniref:hypothetical protein n=1 Tax=Paenibacillus sp. Soil766 TaxID=1736404 RepID=UPI000709D067|nr:hypothetical protein [Paenibacillus sp. Soil766]KRE99823.1 hypothetical protein ASG89_27205 [Paenibacillus sp. Soil766]